MYYTSKVLAVVESYGKGSLPDVQLYVQSYSFREDKYFLLETFTDDLIAEIKNHGIPGLKPHRRMVDGEVIRVALTVRMRYHRGLYDDWAGFEIEFRKVKVLRRQFRKFPYRSKRSSTEVLDWPARLAAKFGVLGLIAPVLELGGMFGLPPVLQRLNALTNPPIKPVHVKDNYQPHQE